MKIVINDCYGGFSLSDEAVFRYGELAGLRLLAVKGPLCTHFYKNMEEDPDNYFNDRAIPRNDPLLVQVVEELGEAANGKYADLSVVDIPDDVDWYIDEYDGIESIHEKHRSWR